MDYPLFDPVKMPILGLKTRLNPFALTPGYWNELQNVKWCGESGVILRGGLGATLGTVLAGGVPKGLATLTLGGVVTHFAAVRHTSETRVYKSTDAVTWTEVTAGSGQYGNTRFTSDGQVFFEVCKASQFTVVTDHVLIQNGTDQPRIYDGSTVYTINDQAAPTDLRTQTVYRSPAAGFDLQAASRTNSGANWAATITGSSPDVYMALARNTTIDANSTITFDHGAGITSIGASFDRQFWAILECSDYVTFWANVKISISTDNFAANNVTVYDPTSSEESKKQPPIVVPFSVTGVKNNKGTVNLFAFSPSFSAMAQYRYTRLTWVGTTAPSASLAAKLYFLGFGGGNSRLPGTTSFGCAYGAPAGQFSKGVVYGNYRSRKLSEFGGTSLSGARFPVSDLLFYRFDLPYRNILATSTGYDKAQFFMLPQGSSQMYWCLNATVSTYGGGAWSLSSGSAGDTLLKQADETTVPDYRIPFPNDQHRNIQIGSAMLWDSNRLFVCTTKGLDVSRLDCPMYHRESVDPNDALFSGFTNRMKDRPKALAATSTPDQGVNQVWVLSDRNAYVTGGVLTSDLSRMTKVAPHGTVNPYTVWEYLGSVYWVDQEMQVRALPGMGNLSKFEVDDQLDGAGRKTNIASAIFKDRYYTFFGTGSVNNRALVWNVPLRKWESVDLYSAHDIEFASRWEDAGVSKMLTIGSDTTVRLLDTSQTVDGTDTPIAVSMTPWSIQGSPEIGAREMSLHAESISSSFTCTRTFAPSGDQITGTITVSAGSFFKWVTESSLTGTGSGLYVTLNLSASITGGMRLQRIAVDTDKASGGPSAS